SADRWIIEDLGSRNGTRVDGRSVAHLALGDGDLVEAGHAFFLFRERLHAPPESPLDVSIGAAAEPSGAPGAELADLGLGTVVPGIASDVDALARIAPSGLPVLLRGETGTGKEVAARAVHALSKRAGAFVAVNCGAIPDALVESQLFGHVKGAFSGAVRDEPGWVRSANGGTLFLDEIGDLRTASQAALLRVLQEREVVPVGAMRPVAVDLRVIAATHRPLEALVAQGTFRADLLARLDGFTFTLRPLRERREDMGLLVARILGARPDKSPVAFTPAAARALLRYDWPLNVRELALCLARACALSSGAAAIDLGHLPPALRPFGEPEAPVDPGAGPVTGADSADARLRTQLETLLAEHEGNVAEVARSVGKARMQVHRWLKRLAIDPDRYRR
ncbi:MAG TPA: sigma 54-interacting transcriptional regulator, partial [Polyangiaceae bacterium]|nr:sigma 54-interacting transcriptional regulator [Polyangiaceae bacterium]